MDGFIAKLDRARERSRSLLCVGLDPVPERMPVASIFEFNRTIIEATQDLVCAYKPNLAFYEAYGLEGMRALERTMACIPDEIPVIGDCKRGDIGSTAEAYARAMFQYWGFDAVTVHPYLGQDSVEPFLAYERHGVFVLCRTSNPSAGELQDLPIGGHQEETPLYQRVVERALAWNSRGNLGLVVGATYPGELQSVRRRAPDTPLLIPGVGTQGGDLESAVRNGITAEGTGAVINVSRQVLYASSDRQTYADRARSAAVVLRDRMLGVLQEVRVPWLTTGMQMTCSG